MSELFLCQSIVPRLAIPCLQARSLKEAFLEWRATAQAFRARHHAGRQLACHTARGLTQRITCWQQVETQKHSWVARPACSDQTPPSVHLRHCSAVPAQGQRLGQAMQVLMWGSLARCFLAWRDDTQVRRTALF